MSQLLLIGLVAFGLSSSNPQRSSMTSPKYFFFLNISQGMLLAGSNPSANFPLWAVEEPSLSHGSREIPRNLT